MSNLVKKKSTLIHSWASRILFFALRRSNKSKKSNSRIKAKIYRLCVPNLVPKMSTLIHSWASRIRYFTREILDLPCALSKLPSCLTPWTGRWVLFRNEFCAAVFAFMEILLAKKPVSNFPEHVWLHRSASKCFVQLNIFAVWRSENVIKSHSSVGHVLK